MSVAFILVLALFVQSSSIRSLSGSGLPPCPENSKLNDKQWQCICADKYEAVHEETGGIQRRGPITLNQNRSAWQGVCIARTCHNNKWQYLLIEGGGVKGIALAGAVRALEDADLLDSVQGFSGTSAGSQVAALLAAGYSGKELMQFLLDFDFRDLLHEPTFGPISRLGVAKRTFGWYPGDRLEEHFDWLISLKTGLTGTTFKQLYDHGCKQGRCKRLRMPALCVNTGEVVYFDAEATPDIKVATAVRASSSIPFFFQPTHIMMPDGKERLFVDGMLTRNLPHDAFELGADIGVLAFILRGKMHSVDTFPSIKDFAAQLATAIVYGEDSANSLSSIEQDAVDLLPIDTGEVEPTDFDLQPSSVGMLINNGYLAMREKIFDCEQTVASSTIVHRHELPEMPAWLQDTLGSRFMLMLQHWGSFSTWWPEEGRDLFKNLMLFTGNVSKESEYLSRRNLRQVDIFAFGHTTVLITLRKGVPRDVFSVTGPVNKIDSETNKKSCLRPVMTKISTKSKPVVEIDLCGDADFNRALCDHLGCAFTLSWPTEIQGQLDSARPPLFTRP